MKNRIKKATAAISTLVIGLSTIANATSFFSADAAYGNGGNGTAVMEYLDRGIYAIKSGDGMFISWRFNADDSDNSEFRLYRDDELIYISSSNDPTNYWDSEGTSNSKYRVDTLSGNTVISSEECKFKTDNSYFDIDLNKPGNEYMPNDCSVGDVDGDGQYEIILKWDPNNSQDNSIDGVTSNVYIDCYTLEGKQLWRINMGQNIRAGQHYTQMCVADFDLDGKSEFITKTADGTVDGTGKTIGDGSKYYANSVGRVLDGPEYMTLFDGATGAALDTIDFTIPRGNVSNKATWGDNYGNRVDRFNSGIAYLDGVHPSAVYGRGYYTRLTMSAFDVVDKKLKVRWIFDSNDSSNSAAYGNGNHNIMSADVDNDGKQEIFMGATCIDDNGSLLWCNNLGHGDAMHLGDFIPSREGLEAWVCHEKKPYGVSLLDARTGEKIFHYDASKDTGRCGADNVLAGNGTAEFWGAASSDVYDATGNSIGTKRPAQNFFIYWDGDLEREILDGNTISKMTSIDKIETYFVAEGCVSNNSTKAVPSITADIFGDWREELVLPTVDGTKLRVWCTNNETEVRLTTLMHDTQYRTQTSCEQSAYNQPPHTSFYLGSEAPLPQRPQVMVLKNGETTAPQKSEGKYIKLLDVKDSTNYFNWSIQNNLSVGDTVFGDRTFKFTSVPDEIAGCEWIKTACESKRTTENEAKFSVGENSLIYIGLDSRIETVPSWMNGWTKTDISLTDDGNPIVTYNMYVKECKAGDKITLGAIANGSVVNYVVIAKEMPPVTTTTTTTTTTETETATTITETTVLVTSMEERIIWGDVNCDGTINMADAILIMQSTSNPNKYGINGSYNTHITKQGMINGDVTGNSNGITNADALSIQKYCLKTIDSLPDND